MNTDSTISAIRDLKQGKKEDWKNLVNLYIKVTNENDDLFFFEPNTLVFMREHATKKQQRRLDNTVLNKLTDTVDDSLDDPRLSTQKREEINLWLTTICECTDVPSEIRTLAEDGIVETPQEQKARIDYWIDKLVTYPKGINFVNVDELVNVLKDADDEQRQKIEETVVKLLAAKTDPHALNSDPNAASYKYDSLIRGWVIDLAFNPELTPGINQAARDVWKHIEQASTDANAGK